MTQRHSHRSSRAQRPISKPSGSTVPNPRSASISAETSQVDRTESSETTRSDNSRTERQWAESRQRYPRNGGHYGGNNSGNSAYTAHTALVRLIEQDAPLFGRSQLVLMYGPFQAEMPSEAGGVATWIKSCLNKHGIPSLVRFDDRRCAQVFRRDQFQPWVEHLIEAPARNAG
jgi:hypothetical protein